MKGRERTPGILLNREQCEYEDRWETGVGTWCEQGDAGTGRRTLPEGKT